MKEEPIPPPRKKKSADRLLIEEIAKLWPGHRGVNYDTTTTINLLLLIKDAVEGDRRAITGV